MSTETPSHCPVCGTAGGEPFVRIDAMPVFCNAPALTAAEARQTPRGDVHLVFCSTCGMIWNSRFDSSLLAYSPAYENSLHFSAVFEQYAQELAQRLVDRYDLRGSDVIEIGSGKGEFLELLCRLGGNRCVGYDPSYEGEPYRKVGDGTLRFVRELYAGDGAGANFVCSRHVLEHVERPVEFLQMLRLSLGEDSNAVVYIEVPAAEYLLSELSAWDIIYEHRSIFSGPALRRAVEAAGFEVLDLGRSFGDQYLWVEARAAPLPGPVTPPGTEVDGLAALAARFDSRFRQALETWSSEVRTLGDRGTVAVWGAGSKGVTFLNLAAPERAVVVDVNPRKRGLFVVGRGDRIISPSDLAAVEPVAVLVMNPIYRDEIAMSLADHGVEAELVVV
jgi:hypothetical protein